MSKTDKLTTAIANVSAKKSDTPPPTSLAALAEETTTGIAPIDLARLRELATSGDYEVGARLAELKEGQQIEGRLVSSGVTEIPDLVTGEVKQISTYQIDVGGAVLSILGSAQLDRQLPALIGRDVVIARGGTIRTKRGMNVSEYFVAAKRLPIQKLIGEDLLP
jgi:hypothetical protein